MTTMMRNGMVVVVLLVVVVVLGCSGMSGVRAQTFTPTNEVSAVCQITDFEVPEDQTDEEIAAVTEFFEGRFERYFNLFLPCVVSTPWNPSFSCCANLNQIWGAYEEADYPNCLCLDGWFDQLVESFRDQYDIITLYNTCVARFPTTFVVNFDSPPTEYSFGVNRCTPDRVIVPTDYVNPFVNVTAEDLGITDEDQDLVVRTIAEELEAAAAAQGLLPP